MMKMLVPCHYEMLEFNKVLLKPFEAVCKRLCQNYNTLENGGRLSPLTN